MTKVVWGFILSGVFVAMTFLTVATWLDKQESDRRAKERASILQAQLAEAQSDVRVDSVEVVKRVTQTRTIRDTLNIHDTTQVIQYLYQTDTLRLACTACIESAARLRGASDSSIAFWKGRYESVRPSWKDRLGIHLGYGLTKTGSDLKVGPQVGVSIRVWP